MRTYSREINTQLNEMFFPKQLEYCNTQLEEAKKQLLKDIKNIEEIQQQVYNRYQEVLQLNYTYEVNLHRYHDSKNHIIYDIRINKVPILSKEEEFKARYYNLKETQYYKKYTGKQRREALKDAEDQAKQYRVNLKKIGF